MAADGRFVKSLPSPINLPNEPVDVAEPLTLPLGLAKEPLMSSAI